MRTVGVVVEYNPFHNGHLYHLQQAKKVTSADTVVAVMSGNFLQRGEPALVDKWTRAEMALCGGADLVLELPVVYACQSAEWFAFGAVAVLEWTGVVDTLCFGSESGELDWMLDVAATLAREPQFLRESLQYYLKQGWSYPRAYGRTLQHVHPDLPTELAKPNNILGISYLAALHKLNSRIEPFTIRREKAGYHQTELSDESIASATAIRHAWLETKDMRTVQPYVPSSTYRLLKAKVVEGVPPLTWESFHQALFAKLVSATAEELRQYYAVEEGLEYRLKQQLRHSGTVNEYIAAMKTKRYTWNRLQRILTYVLLGLQKTDVTALKLTAGPAYIRVLGFTEYGRELLKQMKETAAVPVITRIKRERPPMLEWDIRASQLYNLASAWKLPFKEEFERSPVYLPSRGACGNSSK